jgi:hypothetical protein
MKSSLSSLRNKNNLMTFLFQGYITFSKPTYSLLPLAYLLIIRTISVIVGSIRILVIFGVINIIDHSLRRDCLSSLKVLLGAQFTPVSSALKIRVGDMFSVKINSLIRFICC